MNTSYSTVKNKQAERKSERKQESRQFPYDSKDLWSACEITL